MPLKEIPYGKDGDSTSVSIKNRRQQLHARRLVGVVPSPTQSGCFNISASGPVFIRPSGSRGSDAVCLLDGGRAVSTWPSGPALCLRFHSQKLLWRIEACRPGIVSQASLYPFFMERFCRHFSKRFSKRCCTASPQEKACIFCVVPRILQTLVMLSRLCPSDHQQELFRSSKSPLLNNC